MVKQCLLRVARVPLGMLLRDMCLIITTRKRSLYIHAMNISSMLCEITLRNMTKKFDISLGMCVMRRGCVVL